MSVRTSSMRMRQSEHSSSAHERASGQKLGVNVAVLSQIGRPHFPDTGAVKVKNGYMRYKMFPKPISVLSGLSL